MSVTILNGSRSDLELTMEVNKILEVELKNAGLNPESIILRNIEDLKHCIGCFGCWDQTPGICKIPGPHREINRKIINSDLLVYLTPLTFGGYSSEIKKMIEFQLGLVLPDITMKSGESHHKKRYKKYPSLLAIATTEIQDEGEERMFKHLIDRHALNWYPPEHRTLVIHREDDEKSVQDRLKSIINEMGLKK